MAVASQLRFSPLPNIAGHNNNHQLRQLFHLPSLDLPILRTPTLPLLHSLNPTLSKPILSGSGSDNIIKDGSGSGSGSGGNGGRGGEGGGDRPGDQPEPSGEDPVGPLGLFLSGWRARVAADPQFPFKVLMEELVGVSACVLGDMASRPNFGLNELDFVFSTLVVGSILNFVLMYLLAPTAATSAAAVSSLPSYIFEPGPYALSSRIATLVNKGATFAAVGFAAGLFGTALSNGLIKLRKKMDPEFDPPNKPPPTLLNSVTWAAHMGISSNLRYQTLNGVEFLMGKALPPAAFKVSVVGLRCLNNVLGGMSFVVLARLTGSQKVEEKKAEEESLITGTTTETTTETTEMVVRGNGDDEQSSN